MKHGAFTGRKISEFVQGTLKDFKGARKSTIKQDNDVQVEKYATMLNQFSPPYKFDYDSPLTLENIFFSTFQNPNRKDFPNYPYIVYDSPVAFRAGQNYELLTYYIETLKENSFNSNKLVLTNLNSLYATWSDDPKLPPVDKDQYLQDIKNSRWYGPYQSEKYHYFFSKVNEGRTEFVLRLTIELTPYKVYRTTLHRFKVSDEAH